MKGIELINESFGDSIKYHIGYSFRFLLRRSFLLEKIIEFPCNVYFEDTVWMPKVLFYANRVQGCNIFAYNYWHHSSSIMGSFAKMPSAKKIYDWSIVTGMELYNFSKELQARDEDYYKYSRSFEEYAISRYINYLPILIGRANNKEITGFYKLLHTHSINSAKMMREILSHANILTRLLVLAPFGYWFARLLSLLYKISHKKWL